MAKVHSSWSAGDWPTTRATWKWFDFASPEFALPVVGSSPRSTMIRRLARKPAIRKPLSMSREARESGPRAVEESSCWPSISTVAMPSTICSVPINGINRLAGSFCTKLAVFGLPCRSLSFMGAPKASRPEGETKTVEKGWPKRRMGLDRRSSRLLPFPSRIG